MPKHDLIAAHGTTYPYDPAANSTEDLEPRITRGDMVRWLEQVLGAGTVVVEAEYDRPMLDAIIAHLKAH